MILLDFSQTMISALMTERRISTGNWQAERGKDAPMPAPTREEYTPMLRHLVLNTIRGIRSRFFNEYGELVICCDSKKNWRRDIFPHYKAQRRISRQASEDSGEMDWKTTFDVLGEIREEVRDNLPYPMVTVEGAEADDVIGALCISFGDTAPRTTIDSGPLFFESNKKPKILIYSSDRDFAQLQRFSNVYQYSPFLKSFIKEPNPARCLMEHVLRGDKSDGVPNFLSDGDTFVIEGKRQKPIRQKDLDQMLTQTPDVFCTTPKMREGFERNQNMIDLRFMPGDIYSRCLLSYEEAKINAPSRSRVLDYLVRSRLKKLTELANDF